jgi:hypothetical protein
MDGGGAVYMLYRGFPRLLILDSGEVRDLDLPEVAVPGGLCVLEGGQVLVSDRTAGLVLRYSDEGEVLEVLEAPGSPGDVAAVGLEVWYVSREECVVRSAGDGRVVFRPPEGCRPASADLMRVFGGGEGGVLTDGAAWSLPPGRRPRLLCGDCLDVAMAGGEPVLLLDSTTAAAGGDTVALPRPAGRLAGSPSGRFMVWSESSGAPHIPE